MSTGLLGLAAAAWGVVMALAPVLQIRKMIQSRASDEVSIGYFGLLLVGFGLWVAYGGAAGNWVIIVPNALSFLVTTVTIMVSGYYRRHRRSAASDRESR